MPRLPRVITVLAWLALGLFRILPLALPYEGQAALDGLEFSPVVLDSKGGELQVLPMEKGLRRVWHPLGAFNPDLVRVVLAAEDRRFWLHPGVDVFSLLRALVQNQAAESTVSGASTISMQLARLIMPRSRSWTSKIAEAWQALQLESRLGKEGVLELYLNLVPFGRNVQGFPAAARIYYGKDASALGREEAMVLAVIPRSPTAYDPWSSPARNREAVGRLSGLVPGMVPGPAESAEAGPATGAESDSATGLASSSARGAEAGSATGAESGSATSLAGISGNPALEAAYGNLLDPGRKDIWPFRTPQYVQWLIDRSEFARRDNRLPYLTAIEPRLQSWLEDLLVRTVKEAARKRISNAASVFVRPDTMAVAAWVGSVDFYDPETSGQIDGVTMERQPGSTLKPFLYAMALGKGLTAASVLPDIPLDFGGEEVYTPSNFNDQFNGPVRLRQALASSLNIPAVWTLQRIGVMPFTDFLIQAGFESLKKQRGSFGLGLALGNAGIRLLELVQAYGVFVHQGEFRPIAPQPGKAGSTRILEPSVADLVRDILTRHPDRVLAFGRNSNTRLKFDGAMKTGTSNQFNNIWAVGFTPDLLGGVWMGNFSGSTVQGTADSGYPARIISKTLEAFSDHPPFPPPQGLEKARICSLSGKLATPACPFDMEELFLPGTVPGPCDWHAGAPGQVQTRYPQEYQSWLARYRYKRTGTFHSGEVRITRPQDQSVYFIDPTAPRSAQEISLEALGNGEATILLDGEEIDGGSFPLKIWLPLEPGMHQVVVRGEGSGGEIQEDRVTWQVR